MVLAGALLAAIAGATPAGAQSASPTEVVGFVNSYRAAIGLPGTIAHEPRWSEACRLHNEYGSRHRVLAHSEDPAKPGYTAEGHWAGQNSVLYAGSMWTQTRNPFETAPFHLHQLLNPRIDRMGASENSGYGCATTLASRGRAAPAGTVTYTYPANGRSHRSSEVASEGPYTPGSRVGIPEGTRTGPYLYVMFDGPWNAGWSRSKVDSATMTGPGGAVEVRIVDQTTPGAGVYLPIGAQIIPVAPLQAGATYTVSVAGTVTDPYDSHANGQWVPKNYPVSHTWSFTATAEALRSARQDGAPSLQETDFPVPRQRDANPPPKPSILKAKVRGPNVHVLADVGDVGHVTALLENRRHKGRGKWRTIDTREDALGRVKLVGRVPVGVSYVRVDSSDLERFQPEVVHGPKDHPEGHSETLGPDGFEGSERAAWLAIERGD